MDGCHDSGLDVVGDVAQDDAVRQRARDVVRNRDPQPTLNVRFELCNVSVGRAVVSSLLQLLLWLRLCLLLLGLLDSIGVVG